ncbi:MAG: hypothetical protein ABL931_08125 [Usitatibacteraceae bacterium]
MRLTNGIVLQDATLNICPTPPITYTSNHAMSYREGVMMYLVPAKPLPAVEPQAATMEELLAQIPYARITDPIRQYWGKAYCDEFLNSLLINDRTGNRQGFSDAIAHAIFALITLNELTRRRKGEIADKTISSDHDWANETGKWKIVKSREAKKSPGVSSTSGDLSYGR